MTEAEWQTSDNPRRMQEFLARQASQRKWQLFCCAGARGKLALGPGNADEQAQQAIQRWEILIDDGTTADHLEGVWQPLLRKYPESSTEYRAIGKVLAMLTMCPTPNSVPISWALSHEWRDEASRWTDYLRDIFGPLPFRSVALEPAWQTANAVGVAQGIHADYAFDRLPILADALEDAGCSNRDILDHCRSAGTHVRGCWVIDLVLGKS